MSAKTAKKKAEKKGTLRITINQAYCKGCEICVAFCPKEVLAMRGKYPEVIDLENCIECDLCEMLCPDFAIRVDRILEK